MSACKFVAKLVSWTLRGIGPVSARTGPLGDVGLLPDGKVRRVRLTDCLQICGGQETRVEWDCAYCVCAEDGRRQLWQEGGVDDRERYVHSMRMELDCSSVRL